MRRRNLSHFLSIPTTALVLQSIQGRSRNFMSTSLSNLYTRENKSEEENALISKTVMDIDSIWTGEYSGNQKLGTVIISEYVKSIRERAFANCTNLTSVALPNSITEIVFGTFEFWEAWLQSHSWVCCWNRGSCFLWVPRSKRDILP